MPSQDVHECYVDALLDELHAALPAISLEGAKAVGKTRTAMRWAGTVYRLDDPAQREIVEADPGQLVEGNPPILVDEWQRVPESWDIVRRAVDDDLTPGPRAYRRKDGMAVIPVALLGP